MRRRRGIRRGRDAGRAEAPVGDAVTPYPPREPPPTAGFEFDLYTTSPYDFLRDPAEVIQANLLDIGVTANIVLEDWSIYLPKVLARDYTATILGSSGQTDPDASLHTTTWLGN